MSEISSNLRSSAAEEIRLKNHKASLQQKSDMELREHEQRHNDELLKMTESHAFQSEELKRAYEVQISQEAEALEEQLQKIRANGEERIEGEKRRLDAEAELVRNRGRAKIDEYRRNSDDQIDRLRKETQLATEMIHDRAKKAAKKEREGVPS